MNIIATLVRVKKEQETKGYLIIGNTPFETLELPWRDNKRSVSCVPDGIYDFVKDWSNNKQRFVIELRDVPNRSQIQIHYAKKLSWLKGCIGVSSLEEEKRIYTLLKNGGKIQILTIE